MLTDRIILVTGASRGLGRAVALEASRAGAQVIAVARTKGGLENLDDEVQSFGNSVTLLPLDITQGDQLDRLGPSIFQRFGRLDALCHCAAELGILTRVTDIAPTVLERIFKTNVFATQRLLRTIDPLFRASAAPAIVAIADRTASAGKAYWGPYAASKLAFEALIRAYRAETAFRAFPVNMIDPGPMATRLRAQAYPGEGMAQTVEPQERALQILPFLAANAAQQPETVSL